MMMTSALMQYGIAYLERVRQDLGRWLGDNGWKSVFEIQCRLNRRAVETRLSTNGSIPCRS
jgi:hypothetical protein